ncbi:PREDICTED: F-box protein At5g51380 [Tarenaya hassleriana]|uniref:F-box protein At5g51380 n=1 Tax=Tarenaya hassleriana TaxID=28532 RepID=UPI00053C13BF|nr:PREDICTED: F-box protein At5g51380 [Tarenaya hassleriana]
MLQTMSFREKTPTSPKSPLRRRRSSWSDAWINNASPLKNVVCAMPVQSSSFKSKTLTRNFSIDRTLALSDALMLKILEKLPDSQKNAVPLVCKRWMNLQGGFVRTIKVLDWDFLLSGRLISRFPKLSHVDLVSACLNSPRSSGILLNHMGISFHIPSDLSSNWDFAEENLLPNDMVDRGLRALSRGGCNLRKLIVINATELGLLGLAEECLDLQELELHKCNDNLLRGIAACENLQALRLIGRVDALYSSSVSDIGLTILAQGCKRLVKLELSGCEGGFDGMKAIGQCCEMLDELVICDHRMEDGWLAALSYFDNLKKLRITSCRKIDPCPGPEHVLGSCPALERLHLNKCCLNDKNGGVRALFRICEEAAHVSFQDCWGLDNDAFSEAKAFRRVRYLSLEGCSRLTTDGLESVILHWEELESLRVESCKSIKDGEISLALSSLFSLLKELTWRPDTRSHLSSVLESTAIGRRGSKFFKKR